MDRRTEEARAREMAGPGGFTLERMLSIMQVLLRDAAGEARATTDARDSVLSADVFMQVTSLVSINLLAHSNGVDSLDCAGRYYCNVGDELAKRVAKNVCVPLDKYVVYA